MHGFLRDLITEWRRLGLPIAGKTVVIAVSGGADSVSLLLAMHRLREMQKLDLRIVAAHFNHRLRGAESETDEEFVRHLTAERHIELAVGSGEIPRSGNLEQNARLARYAFLETTAHNVDAFAVLTGHTVNDQAETFLMNLLRGSGVEGLSGMKSIRRFEGDGTGIFLIRPLLSWAQRKRTEGFCNELGVEYKYDTMNEDSAFKRVRVRKVLLPLLEDFNPKIVETLANTAGLMQQYCDDRRPLDTDILSPELELNQLKDLSQPELYRTIRVWLGMHRGTLRRLERKHIQAVEQLMFSEKSGRTAELPGGGLVVRSGGKLAFNKNKVEN